MKIAIGCDHGGYELKQIIIPFVESLGHEVTDFGCYSLSSVDYPDYGFKVAEEVSSKRFDRGIVICSTGIGISIACNKVERIRCALVSDTLSASLTRQHNDANILAMGGKIISSDLAKEITKIFLETEFEGGRHKRRIQKISDYEMGVYEHE